MEAADITSCTEFQKYITILDEMHIKEDLVYNKSTGITTICTCMGMPSHTFKHVANDKNIYIFPCTYAGVLTGFVDIGDIYSHLMECQMSINDTTPPRPVLANSMLVFMVRGLLSDLELPYAQFPCATLTGEQIFLPFWDAVSRLER